MNHLQENFYFVQFDDAIRGPYPLRTILGFFRDGKINIYTQCSADKRNWENLSAVLQRHGVEYATIERTLAMKKASAPPAPCIVSAQTAAPVARSADRGVASAETSGKRALFNAVFGMLWHPASQIVKVSEFPGRAFAIAFGYQLLFALLSTAGRGVSILHRADWWKLLWFAPLEVLAVETLIFVIAGIAIGLCRAQMPEDQSALAAIDGGTMICGTWTMALFALAPAQFLPWCRYEWANVVFLALSFAWFTVMTAELWEQWMATPRRGNRYAAILFAVLMMLGVTAMQFYLIYLYKEF